MLPILKLGSTRVLHVKEASELLASEFKLTDQERNELLPSGKQTKFSNRVHWCISHLVQAGLLERPSRGHFGATVLGKDVLRSNPNRIDIAFLTQYESYRLFRARRKPPDLQRSEEASESLPATPEEQVEVANQELSEAIQAELLDKVLTLSPRAFEKLIVDLMTAMGYGKNGSSRHLGRTGDGGVDGVINEDLLGLDTIYLQAKRYDRDRPVGVDKIREFAGSLDERRATRGVLVTTSTFAPSAREYSGISPKRLVLIDGAELARLMVEYDVGVRTYRSIKLKKVDGEYFEEIES
jgi:restriction system protein